MGAPCANYDPGTITCLLTRMHDGHRDSENALFSLVHHELRSLARRRMAQERDNHTLEPTELVNEAFVRLFRSDAKALLTGRAHFFALAATVMRQILVDHARHRQTEKRGGDCRRVDFAEVTVVEPPRIVDVLILDDALRRLERLSTRASRLVELSFFGGLTVEEAALVLGVSPRTVRRDWTTARAWLHKEIYGAPAATLGSSQ